MTQVVSNADGIHTFPNDATKAEIGTALGADTNGLVVHSFPDDATPQEIGDALGPPPPPGLLKQVGQGIKNIIPNAINSVGTTGAGLASLLLKGLGMNKASQNVVNTSQKAEQELLDKTGTSDQGLGAMAGNILPYVIPGAAEVKVGAGIPSFGEAIAKLYPGLSPLAKSGLDITGSAGLNAGISGGNAQGSGATPDQVKTAMETGSVLGGGLTAASKLIGSAIPPLASKMSSKATPEAYQFAASPGGLDALKTAAKTAPDKVQQLVDIANNSSPYMEHIEQAVRTPENAAGNVDIRPVMQAFDDAKISPNALGGNPTVSNRLNDVLEAEKQAVGGQLFGNPKSVSYDVNSRSPYNFNGSPSSVRPAFQTSSQSQTTPYSVPSDINGKVDYTIPATQLRQLKTSIGKGINWDDPANKPLQAKMADIYGKIDDQLTDAVKNTQGQVAADQYQNDLADWSQKIGDFNELDSRLGKSPSQRLNAADALLQGYGKQGNNDLLNRIDQQTGSDFAQHAQLRDLASQLGMKSQPTVSAPDRTASLPFLPQHINLTKVGIPSLAEHAGGPLAGAAATTLESPLLSVMGLKIAKQLGKGTTPIPPYLSNIFQPKTANATP